MAQVIEVHLTDDLDGSEAAETVAFSVDGTSYEIDLSNGNAKAMRKAFAPFAERARRTGGAAKRPSRRTGESSAVRAWAKEHGLEISQRGRIPEALIAQFRQASAAPARKRSAAPQIARGDGGQSAAPQAGFLAPVSSAAE